MKRTSGMLDARARVTGEVAFVQNVALPGMLHVRLLRSTSPHARLVSVDVSAARSAAGVHAVVTGADLLERPDLSPYQGPVYRDQPIIAISKVRYVGEPIVAVVGESIEAADEALSLIGVEYEDLPAVFNAAEAMAEGAPQIHDRTTTGARTYADIIERQDLKRNICNAFRLRKGNVSEAFLEADHVFEDRFTSPAAEHVPMETHVCVAQFVRGRLNLWASTQTPHFVRAQLAELLGLPMSSVRVMVSNLGGGYGAKGYTKTEPLTSLLAIITGKPVRLQLTREEQAITVTKHAVEVLMKTGVTRAGKLVARQVTCLFNTGAYADIGPRLIKNGGYAMVGPYSIPNVAVDSFAIYTNLPPAGAFRGYGVSQAAWAHETQMDMIADRLNMDPLELRRTNLLKDGDSFATGETMMDCHYRELLDKAAAGIGWEWPAPPVRTGPKVRAQGLSCILKSTVTPSTSTAVVKLNEDASLDILTSSVEMGQGVQTAIAILAAETIGLPLEKVNVSEVDTDLTPYDQSTSSSRSTFSMGAAAVEAVAAVRKQLLEKAGELLEVEVDDLEVLEGRVQVRGVPGRFADIGQVVEQTRLGNLTGTGTFLSQGGLDPETGQGIASVHWHQAAAAAEVEVDLETGAVTVLNYHAATYAGRVVNRVQAEMQVEGNVTFGLGQALFEEMVFDHGQLQNPNLGEYMIPSVRDLPRVQVELLEHPRQEHIHGLGESSLPPTMAAIGNAVFRAAGVRITDLPITPERVLRGLNALQNESNGE